MDQLYVPKFKVSAYGPRVGELSPLRTTYMTDEKGNVTVHKDTWMDTRVPGGSAASAGAVSGAAGSSAASASAVPAIPSDAGQQSSSASWSGVAQLALSRIVSGESWSQHTGMLPATIVPMEVAPQSAAELKIIRYRGMTRRASGEAAQQIIRKMATIRRHREKWMATEGEHYRYHLDYSANGWIYFISGPRIQAWIPLESNRKALPEDSTYKVWEHQEDVNAIVVWEILDGSKGDSADFAPKKSLVEEFVYCAQSQYSTLEAWNEGKAVEYILPSSATTVPAPAAAKAEPKADPKAKAKQRGKGKAKAAPKAQPAPAAVDFDFKAHRIKVACAVFSMIADYNLVAAMGDSTALVEKPDGSRGFGYFPAEWLQGGWDYDCMFTLYIVVLHLLAALGLLSIVERAWSSLKLRSERTRDDDADLDVAIFMTMKKEELREAARVRRLAVSGTKLELSRRLAAWSPLEARDEPATAAQHKFLADLERRTGEKAPAQAYVSKRSASAAIDRLKAIE